MQRNLPSITLSFGDTVITPTVSLKNLGVTMDQNLDWTEHVSETAQKCNKIVFPLSKHGASLSQSVLAKLVQTLVIPHATYCAPVWGGLSVTQCQRLQKTLNRAARVVTKTPRRAHITPVLQQLGWRSVETSIKQRDAMLVNHILHSPLAPVDLRSQFVRRADVSQRRTRAKQNALELPAVKTELARRSLLFRASHLWNRLPDEVTELVSKSLFKSKLPF